MSLAKNLEEWIPRTRAGKLVKEGKITSINQIFENNLPIKEVEIIDLLLPNLKSEIIAVNLVQRQTDAGETSRFKVMVAVGNSDGYIGIGVGKSKQIHFAIEKATLDAKLNVIPVRRGCGSWECLCESLHSIPFKVIGKAGSVEIMLLPAPKGTGLVTGEVAKTLLNLVGIEDIYSYTKGETRTTMNFALATFEALKKTYGLKLPKDWVR
ncbi:MAG: 30S ribosomal protein S5 [Candidatus Methanomethylicia archaeon]